jgi:hypothetical protein
MIRTPDRPLTDLLDVVPPDGHGTLVRAEPEGDGGRGEGLA